MSQKPSIACDQQIFTNPRKGPRWWFWPGTLVLLLVLYRITAGSGHEQLIGPSVAVPKQGFPVDVAAAKRADLNIYLNEIGTVTPFKTVTVHARVDGELIRLYFKEGQMVRAGDLIAEIDPRPYELQFTQAEPFIDPNRTKGIAR